ncbi:MAG TPA: hypothetical protein VGF94_05860 [Kofleriaceae bacterium]
MRETGTERKLAKRLIVPLVLAVTVTAAVVAIGAGTPGCSSHSTPVVDAGHGDANGDTPIV